MALLAMLGLRHLGLVPLSHALQARGGIVDHRRFRVESLSREIVGTRASDQKQCQVELNISHPPQTAAHGMLIASERPCGT